MSVALAVLGIAFSLRAHTHTDRRIIRWKQYHHLFASFTWLG